MHARRTIVNPQSVRSFRKLRSKRTHAGVGAQKRFGQRRGAQDGKLT
jgi:hypothetical protein